MRITAKWEMFYTNSKNDEDFIDQISIDVNNKRYILDLDADPIITESVDEEDNYINSIEVSRFIFDLIVKSIKEMGFTELKG